MEPNGPNGTRWNQMEPNTDGDVVREQFRVSYHAPNNVVLDQI